MGLHELALRRVRRERFVMPLPHALSARRYGLISPSC